MSVSEVTQEQYTTVMDETPWLDEPLTKELGKHSLLRMFLTKKLQRFVNA